MKEHRLVIAISLLAVVIFVASVGLASQASASKPTWLIMLYLDADDEVLEETTLFDLNEAELVGSSDRVHVVAQVDRFEGGFAGDGDWSTAKRFYVTEDADLSRVSSEELMDLGEVNMSDGSTLVEFVSWAMEAYTADRYVLILADHGSGWPGGWFDASARGDMLTLPELVSALEQIQSETLLEQFELIGFDACLMGSLEVDAAVAPYARYAVGSEEIEPALGWAYASFLSDLTADPDMSGADLARSIVRHYIDGDAALIGAPEGRVRQLQADSTLSAVDLARLPDVLMALDVLASAVHRMDQGAVASARFYSRSFFSYLGREYTGAFLDLGNMASVLAEEARNESTAIHQGVTQASSQLLAILDQAVIAEKHGPQRVGSTGMTLYFPNSGLYRGEHGGSVDYATLAGAFATESLWDDFLLAHYTDASLPEIGAGRIAHAEEDSTIVAPGVGNITVAPVTASSTSFSMNRPVFLSTEITGGHIGWIYLFEGRYVEEEKAILVLSKGYLDANEDKEIDGVVYPDWSAQTENGVIDISGNLWPEDLVITDGTVSERALLQPEQYGGGIRRVYGTHISAATGERRYATLRFSLDSAEMLNMVVFAQEGGVIVPREYTPQPGDQFILENTWFDLASGVEYYTDGGVLQFGQEAFWLDTVPSIPGEYRLGVTVIDLDGNRYGQGINLTVEAD